VFHNGTVAAGCHPRHHLVIPAKAGISLSPWSAAIGSRASLSSPPRAGARRPATPRHPHKK
jgi:hypothetical protein